MREFLVRRLAQTVIVLAVVSFVVFLMMYHAGDPISLMLPPTATQIEVQQMKEYWGLDKPFLAQYGIFLKNALRGDLGKSYHHNRPALQLVVERIPATMELATTSMLFALLLAFPLGILVASRPNSHLSKAVMSGSIFGISLPTFWIGIVFILIFAVTLGWLPSSGRGQTVEVVGLNLSILTVDGLKHLLMPALTLSFYHLAMLIRLVRAGMLDALSADHIRTAKAKGLSWPAITVKHALKNTLIPIVTVVGMQFGGLIAFSAITETIFAWPGMGKLVIDSINLLDRPVVLAYLMVIALIFVLINLVVDMLYGVLDPRVRLE